MLEYSSIAELCQAAEQAGTTISQTALADQSEQMEQPADVLYRRMADSLVVMRDAVRAGMDPELRSTSGLTGGDAAKMARYAEQGGITGAFLNRAMARAIAVSEYNAAMGKVVAAPTAGSCGILPGTVVSMLEEGLCDERAAVMALFTAGAIGMVIAQQASIAGAQGGCQAECGSASAMGRRGPGGAVRRNAGPVRPRLCHGHQEPAGAGVRPGGRPGGDPLHQAQRLRHRHRLHRGGDGPCGDREQDPADRLYPGHAGGGRLYALRSEGDGPGGLATTPTGIELKRRVFGPAD